MFSSITIASSTTRPIATTSAIKVNKLILKFANRIARNVDINETGIARVGMTTAERFPKNK